MKDDPGGAVRAFVAVELPSGVKDALRNAQDILRKTGADVKWVRPEGIHLTLKFLGNMDPAVVPELGGALKEAIGGKGAVNLSLSGTGAFPDGRAPRVVWAGLGGDVEGLAGLARLVEDVCERFGFERETRAFRPHLTLGRVKSKRGVKPMMDALDEAGRGLDTAFTADRVCLMRSELRRTGAVYSELEQILLG